MAQFLPPKDLEGKILLASPALRDGNFYKSVILLAEYSKQEGAFGLILNHPTGKKVGDFLTQEEFSDLAKISVFEGGPVGRDHLTFAAIWREGDQLEFNTRMSAETAIQFSKKKNTIVHAFVGYTGWTKNQLEEELETESWYPVSASVTLLKKTHDLDLWSDSLRSISAYHHILSLTPQNLLAN